MQQILSRRSCRQDYEYCVSCEDGSIEQLQVQQHRDHYQNVYCTSTNTRYTVKIAHHIFPWRHFWWSNGNIYTDMYIHLKLKCISTENLDIRSFVLHRYEWVFHSCKIGRAPSHRPAEPHASRPRPHYFYRVESKKTENKSSTEREREGSTTSTGTGTVLVQYEQYRR